MLFPVHKPKHWSLVVSCCTMSHFKCYYYNIQVVYPKLKFILCIDSLHFSNVDEVNWILLYVMLGYTISTYLLGCICVQSIKSTNFIL